MEVVGGEVGGPEEPPSMGAGRLLAGITASVAGNSFFAVFVLLIAEGGSGWRWNFSWWWGDSPVFFGALSACRSSLSALRGGRAVADKVRNINGYVWWITLKQNSDSIVR